MNVRFRTLVLLSSLSLLISSPLFSYIQPSRTEIITGHCNTFEGMLQEACPEHRNIALARFKSTLAQYSDTELMDTSLAYQIKCTVIGDCANDFARQEAKKYSSHTNEINAFVELYSSSLWNKIANKEPLGDPFGRDLKAATQSYFNRASSSTTSYSQPKPSAPPYTAANNSQKTSFSYVYYTPESDQPRMVQAGKALTSYGIENALDQSGLSIPNAKRWTTFFYASVQQNKSVPVNPPTSHNRNAFLSFLDYELGHIQNKLSREIDPIALEQAIQVTRSEKSAEISKFIKIEESAKKFAQMIENLEETVLDNAGISCPVCTQTYKQSDTFGSVDKIQCQSPQGKQCQSVCIACAKKGSFNTCPTCRKGPINQLDLRKQEQSPANWRP